MSRRDPARPASLASVRALAAQHVERRGARAVAREIGISAGALTGFVEGASPYTRTADALRTWFRVAPPLPEQRPALPSPGIAEDSVREALRAAIRAATLRGVAAKAGMSPRGLQLFVEGQNRTSSKTLGKLRDWYVREFSTAPAGVDEVTARAAVALLLQGLPPEEQRSAAEEFAATARRAFARAGLSPPPWA